MDEFKNLHLTNHLCFALYTATNALVSNYSKRLSKVGLSYEQYLVMLVLWQYQQQTVEAIADKLSLTMNATMFLLKELEHASLVECTSGNQNEATNVVSLTVLGNQVQFETSQIQQKMACETGLTNLEHIQLREKLDKMLDNFKTRLHRPDNRATSLPADL